LLNITECEINSFLGAMLSGRAEFRGRLSGLHPRGPHNFIFKLGYRKNILFIFTNI
jgi:hypothetical protein